MSCRSPIVAHHGSPAAQQCTQTPQSGTERLSQPICVHYCDPKATHNPSPQPNSVHKRPKSTRRDPILPSVYTIAAMRSHPRHDSVHKRPNLASEGPCHPFVYTIAIPRPPTTQAHSPTVYTNAPNRRGEARSSHSCTLLQPRGVARDATVYTNAQNWRREARSSHLCTLLRPRGVVRSTTVYTNAPIRRGEA